MYLLAESARLSLQTEFYFSNKNREEALTSLCVCVRAAQSAIFDLSLSLCVCVCAREREMYVCLCVCVCVHQLKHCINMERWLNWPGTTCAVKRI